MMPQMAVDVVAIASTLYFEAANQSLAGKRAVATVIDEEYWASEGKRTWEQVVKNPKRYSCWRWDNMATRVQMRLALRLGSKQAKTAWRDCCLIAEMMVSYSFVPVQEGWTNYCRVDCDVAWKSKLRDAEIIGDHIFGRLEA